MDKVGVVILNYKSSGVVKDCLLSLDKLKKNARLKVQIVVIDNQYNKTRLNRLKSLFPKIEFIHQTKNLGFVGGNNFGLRYLLKKGCTYFCLLNNDTYVDPLFLNHLYSCFCQHKNAGLISPKIYFAKGHELEIIMLLTI